VEEYTIVCLFLRVKEGLAKVVKVVAGLMRSRRRDQQVVLVYYSGCTHEITSLMMVLMVALKGGAGDENAKRNDWRKTSPRREPSLRLFRRLALCQVVQLDRSNMYTYPDGISVASILTSTANSSDPFVALQRLLHDEVYGSPSASLLAAAKAFTAAIAL